MGTAEPVVSILMALYEPRLDWLREQLTSLNGQDYPNLRLYIRDDASVRTAWRDIRDCVKECITAFPYSLWRNEENIGSSRTFERLTMEAEGSYFAYCDQDDIWLREKIRSLTAVLYTTGALLACSDMYVIDEEQRQIADSIRKLRPGHRFYSGSGLSEKLLLHNFVTGCTMMLRSEEAKAAVPFCPYMVHDHYLALWCAARGRIISLPQPLIRYRIHGRNQTGFLAGVIDRASYQRCRIDTVLWRLEWLSQNFPCDKALGRRLPEAAAWLQARQEYWHSGRKGTLVWKYRYLGRPAAWFELVAGRLPDRCFRQILSLGKKRMK